MAVKIMPYDIDWEIPAGLNNFETHFFEFPNIQTNVREHFDAGGVTLDEVRAIQGRQANLVILNRNLTLEDIRTVEVFLIDPQEPQKEFEAFYTLDLQNPNQRMQNIQLIPTLSNLKPIYNNERMDVVVRINFWRSSTRTLPVRLEMELEAIK